MGLAADSLVNQALLFSRSFFLWSSCEGHALTDVTMYSQILPTFAVYILRLWGYYTHIYLELLYLPGELFDPYMIPLHKSFFL